MRGIYGVQSETMRDRLAPARGPEMAYSFDARPGSGLQDDEPESGTGYEIPARGNEGDDSPLRSKW